MRHQLLGLCAITLLAGCGGGNTSTSQTTAPLVGAATGTAQFTIVIPAKSANSANRSLKYISPSTKSVSITVNNTGAAQVVNVSPGSPGCTTASGGTTCVVNVVAPVGNDTFLITMYDQPGAAGNNLGSGTQSATVVAGQTFNVNVTAGGNISKLLISVTPTAINTVTIAAVAQDAGGNAIVGPFANLVAVSANGANATLSGTSLASSSSTVTATGTGSATVTLTAGTQTASVQLPMTTLQTFPLKHANANPFWMTKGPDGNVWFTELGPMLPIGPPLGNGKASFGTQGYVATVTSAGVVSEFALTAASLPVGIASGPDGNLWVSEFVTNSIARVTPSGQVTEFPLPSATANPTSGISSNFPRGMALGSDGKMWFAGGQGSGRIGNITTTGTASFTSILAGPNGKERAQAITAGPDGNLWFGDFLNAALWRVTTAGVATSFAIPNPNAFPRFLTTGPDGRVWFTDIGSNTPSGNPPFTPAIAASTTAGVVTEFAYPVPNGVPDQIALGPDGNIWYGDLIGAFGKVTTTGTFQLYGIVTSGTVGGVNTNTLNGIAFGSDNALYYVNMTDNAVVRVVTGAGWLPMPATMTLATPSNTTSPYNNVMPLGFLESGNSGPFTVTSSTPNVATVTVAPNSVNTWLVTAVASGATTITVVDAKGRTALIPVTVQ